MTQASKQYTREFAFGMAGYVLLIVAMVLLKPLVGDSPLRFAVVLLPVLPALFCLRAYLRFLVRMDELQQRIQLTGIGFSFGTMGLITFSYGFLELAGFPHFPTIWVFPLMIALWGVGVAYASWRYR